MTDVQDFQSAVTTELEESMNGHEEFARAEENGILVDDVEQNPQAPPLDTNVIGLVNEVMESVTLNDDFRLTDDESALLDALLRETGKSAHGIGAIEVYAFNNPRLIPVASWISSDIMLNPCLTESDRDLLLHPTVCFPNNDFVGDLWSTEELAKAKRKKTTAQDFSSLVGRTGKSGERATADRTLSVVSPSDTRHKNIRFNGTPPRPRDHVQPPPTRPRDGQSQPRHRVVQPPPIPRDIPRLTVPKGLHWRELRSVIEDPDLSHGPRTEAFYKAGLDKAAGIEFNASGSKGMIVYYAKAGADANLVTAEAHETYLKRVTQVKAALLAAFEARRASLGLLPDINADSPANETSATEATSTTQAYPPRQRHLRKCVKIWLKKALGGDAQIPRCMSWYETLWTFCGSFVGLLLIFALNEACKIVTDEEYFIVAGPFGALTMLQYGMTGAPAAQPRSVIFGFALSGSTSLILTYFPERILPLWLRMILSPTIAICLMMKLGVPCPPAAAHSLIYSEGLHNWRFFGMAMLGSFLSLFPAIAINNLNPKRQYPTFWGYSPKHLARYMKGETQEQKEKKRNSE